MGRPRNQPIMPSTSIQPEALVEMFPLVDAHELPKTAYAWLYDLIPEYSTALATSRSSATVTQYTNVLRAHFRKCAMSHDTETYRNSAFLALAPSTQRVFKSAWNALMGYTKLKYGIQLLPFTLGESATFHTSLSPTKLMLLALLTIGHHHAPIYVAALQKKHIRKNHIYTPQLNKSTILVFYDMRVKQLIDSIQEELKDPEEYMFGTPTGPATIAVLQQTRALCNTLWAVHQHWFNHGGSGDTLLAALPGLIEKAKAQLAAE